MKTTTDRSKPTSQTAAATANRESEVRSYSRTFPTTFVSASGSTMVDHWGRTYIDFLAGCGALNYGHNDPDMAAAIVAHLESGGIAHGLDMATTAKDEFIAALTELMTDRQLDHRIQFTGPTGANAVEAALKLARKVTGRSQVVAFTNGFHGVTAGALAASGNAGNRMAPVLPLPGVLRALYDGYLGPDVDTAELLDALLNDASSGFDPPAAILLEVVQGEGGLNQASDGWLRRIAEVARQHGALLIVDDIQAGCGRTGSFFSFERAGVVPDLITLSKSLSGFGLPLSVLLLRPEIDIWSPGEHNGTFRGNNLAFVTATVALRKFWSGSVDRGGPALVDEVSRRADLVRGLLTRLAETNGFAVKGRGMMVGLDVGDGPLAERICNRCFDNGLIVERSGPDDEVVKVLAPLTTPDPLLIEGMEVLSEAVEHELIGLDVAPVAG